MWEKSWILFCWFLFICMQTGICKLCESSTFVFTGEETNDTSEFQDYLKTTPVSLGNAFNCPQPHDPVDYTECCWNSVVQCCPARPVLYQIDDQLVMIVGLIVINTCLFLTILIVVCCFWSHCPLYNTCRINYTQGDIIAYSKEDDPLNAMPPEDKDGQHHYSPNSIKIKPVEDV